MSCGKPHEVDCSDVLDNVYDYLHAELDETRLAAIRRHLDECRPCLQEYGLEQIVRDLLHRSCHCTPAPEQLRSAIITRITRLRHEGRLG